jgi:hypothetical protein
MWLNSWRESGEELLMITSVALCSGCGNQHDSRLIRLHFICWRHFSVSWIAIGSTAISARQLQAIYNSRIEAWGVHRRLRHVHAPDEAMICICIYVGTIIAICNFSCAGQCQQEI